MTDIDEPAIQRRRDLLIIEKDELGERIDKLRLFLSTVKDFPESEHTLVLWQLTAMEHYSFVLGLRIDALQ